MILQFKDRLSILTQFIRPIGILMANLLTAVKQIEKCGYSVVIATDEGAPTSIVCSSLSSSGMTLFDPYMVSPDSMIEVSDGSAWFDLARATGRVNITVDDVIVDRLANWIELFIATIFTAPSSIDVLRSLRSIGGSIVKEFGDQPFRILFEEDLPEGEVCGDIPCESSDEVRVRRSKGSRKRGKG